MGGAYRPVFMPGTSGAVTQLARGKCAVGSSPTCPIMPDTGGIPVGG